MTLAHNIKWIPALLAAFSLLAVQLVHFGEAEVDHANDAAGHSHDISHESGGEPGDGHGDADHCVAHGACHLLQHAMGSSAQGSALAPNTGHGNWRLSQYRFNGLTLRPPTPPPLT